MPNCGYNLPKFRVVVCFLTRFAVALKTAAKLPEKLGFQESTPRYSEVIQPQVRKKEACEKLSSVETKTRVQTKNVRAQQHQAGLLSTSGRGPSPRTPFRSRNRARTQGLMAATVLRDC